MSSLAYHCGLREGLRKDGPSLPLHNTLMSRAERTFECLRWEIPEDFLTYEHYKRTLGKLDLTSSPGYPYMRRAPINRDFFGWTEETGFSESSVNYMWEIISQRLDQHLEADPIRLFIKQEPHKLKKIETKRYRLISSVSVADQLIDHMLFDVMNDKMKENWNLNPVKVGWSPLSGGWKAMPMGQRLAIDKSSWDWTVQLWICEFILNLRLTLCETKGELRDKWISAAKYRYEQLYASPLFITSGGVLLRQNTSGVQKSGCVNTIADNSLAQWVLDNRVRLENGITSVEENLWAMGDDTNQSSLEDMDSYLTGLGQYCYVKEAELVNEFAGFRFYGYRIEPMYKGKHAFCLLHLNPAFAAEVANSYTLLYHRSIYRGWMRNIFTQMGLNILPHWANDAIYDGLE